MPVLIFLDETGALTLLCSLRSADYRHIYQDIAERRA